MGSNCGDQFFGFAVALTNSCSEERQLWGVVLERNFGKPLSETTFGGRLSSCSEQLSITSLGNSFVEQVWRRALGSRSNFEQQLNGDHLWEVALERSFREPLWRIALGNALGNRLKHTPKLILYKIYMLYIYKMLFRDSFYRGLAWPCPSRAPYFIIL